MQVVEHAVSFLVCCANQSWYTIMLPKQEEADKLGVDISQCTIEDPKTSPRVDKYVDLLCEARKHKVCRSAQQHALHLIIEIVLLKSAAAWCVTAAPSCQRAVSICAPEC